MPRSIAGDLRLLMMNKCCPSKWDTVSDSDPSTREVMSCLSYLFIYIISHSKFGSNILANLSAINFSTILVRYYVCLFVCLSGTLCTGKAVVLHGRRNLHVLHKINATNVFNKKLVTYVRLNEP